MKLISCFSIILLLLLASCNTSDNLNPSRPGQEVEDVADYQSELSDNSMRISWQELELQYESGGIIFSEDDQALISVVRLSDGLKVEFDSKQGKFSINGNDIGLKSAELLKEERNCRWYKLVVKDSAAPIFIVLNDL